MRTRLLALSKPIHILIYQLRKQTCPPEHRKRPFPQLDRPAGNRRSGRPRTATAASKIYSDLRIELVSLERRPGEVISEAQIALSYGVSRTPVREAILKLSDEGLLEIYPQSGIFVSRIPIAALPEAIIIRKALEETTARLAAERATSSQILALRSVLERQREACAAGDSDTFHQADELFHRHRRRRRRLPRNLEIHPAGESPRRSLSPADPAAAGTNPEGDRRA